ncbi:MAG: S24 family peptidase [Lentisphaeria bacterium]|nr:S24 family peptidase [Lentisphaeria bacterium]
MRITPELRSCLERACGEVGGAAELARRADVNKANLSRYLNGQSDSISDRNWTKLLPVLRPYLTPSALRSMLPSGLAATVQGAAAGPGCPECDAEAVMPNPSKLFPIISDAAAAEVNTLYYPLADYADASSAERQYFQDGRPGDVVLRVTGESMMPWYPPGTLLLIRPNQRLENGQRVIAIMEDGDVIFKVFVQKEERIALFSINQSDGRDYLFPPHRLSEVRGLYQVISSVRNELELDAAMNRAGIHHFWESKLEKL